VASAVWLDGSARRAVHHLKYDGWWRLADAMASVMVDLPSLTRNAVLVPVPLSASRQRTRGYNQSAKLAAFLGKRRGLPVRSHLLERTRDTRTQTLLTPEEREANLRGAFAAKGPIGETVRVVLVDDVFTTGATLAGAAAALLGAGAVAVSAVTFARATRPLAGTGSDRRQ
jgi:ComF family protein